MASTSRVVPVSANRTSRVEEKISSLLDKGSFYEAHQLYRTLFKRLVAQRKVGDAIELAKKGIAELLKAEQWESATDLGVLFINQLKEDKIPVSSDLLETISGFHKMYGTEHQPRKTFIKAAIKWTSLVSEDLKYGHPLLHRIQALAYWQEKAFSKAREHFLYSDRPEDLGDMLVEFVTSQGYPSERDLFLAQTVLQLLVMKNTEAANAVFLVYTHRHPAFDGEEPPFNQAPLANFIFYLLDAIIYKRSSSVFLCLRNIYQKAIDRDYSFHSYLDQIGELHFNIKASNPTSPGIVGNLFGALGEGGLSGLVNSLVGSLAEGRAEEGTHTKTGQEELHLD